MKSASELAKSVVNAANEHDSPSTATEARVWDGVAAGVAAGNPGPTLTEPSGATAGGGAATAVKVALATIVLGAGIAIGIGALTDRPEVSRVEPAKTSLAGNVSEPPAVADPAPVIFVEPDSDNVPDAEEPEPPPARKEHRERKSQPAPEKADTLADEVALLQKGRTALRSGNAAAADKHLREHAKRFPRSKLARERDLTRVKALCALGKKNAATDVARKLVVRDSGAVLRDRIAKTCVGEL